MNLTCKTQTERERERGGGWTDGGRLCVEVFHDPGRVQSRGSGPDRVQVHLSCEMFLSHVGNKPALYTVYKVTSYLHFTAVCYVCVE